MPDSVARQVRSTDNYIASYETMCISTLWNFVVSYFVFYGGLIISRLDEITRELIELGTMALRPAAVRDQTLITPVPKLHPSTETNNPPVDDPSNDGDRGDILFRGQWKTNMKR